MSGRLPNEDPIEDLWLNHSRKTHQEFKDYQARIRKERKDFFQFFATLLVDAGGLSWDGYEIRNMAGYAGERKIIAPDFRITFRSFSSSHTRQYFNGTNILLIQFREDPYDKSRVITLPPDLLDFFLPEVYEIYTQWALFQIEWRGKIMADVPEEDSDERLHGLWAD